MTTPRWEIDSDRHITWWHSCFAHPGFDEVPAGIPIRDGGWTVTCWEPLTVTPSLLCTGCGTHGFITAGQWVSA